ncbi:uncharacterized protein LOC131220193 [Magnolia sinica]|uniref:uncharacterized protein LOC131220193 n=1 Tax=Magnolia sinica TaxID=86752 RepID=UPI00265B3A9A|nr:uncharacterized protein LOC131220193 [Magnolia sinica]
MGNRSAIFQFYQLPIGKWRISGAFLPAAITNCQMLGRLKMKSPLSVSLYLSLSLPLPLPLRRLVSPSPVLDLSPSYSLDLSPFLSLPLSMSLSSLCLDLSFPRFLQRVVPSSISLQQLKKVEERRENRRSITFRILCNRNYSHANKTNMLKVQYKTDCEKFYGRILDNRNVVSVVEGTSKQKTAKIWSSRYPEEPYELAFNITFSEGGAEKFSKSVDDLVSAVRRQSVFFYQL